MAVRERNGNWQADIQFRNQRFRHTFPTRDAAEAWQLDATQRVRRGEPPVEPTAENSAKPAYTLQYAIDAVTARQWAGTAGEVTSVKNADDCATFLGKSTPISSITTDRIDQMVVHFRSQPGRRGGRMSDSTINRKLAALSTLLHFAVTRGWIDRVPSLDRKKEAQHRIRVISENEEAHLLDCLEEAGKSDFRDMVMVLLDAGLRLGECYSLKWEQIEDNHIRVWGTDTKSKRNRSVPMTDRVRVVLAKRRRAGVGTSGPFDSLGPNSCDWAWGRAKELMGLEADGSFVIHACRHTFCTRLVQRGVNLSVVQALAGHESIKTTERYIHMGSPDLKAGIETLNRPLGITPEVMAG